MDWNYQMCRGSLLAQPSCTGPKRVYWQRMLQKQPGVLICMPNLQVGHALENDLAALRVLHSRCIDTAALFPHPKVLDSNLPSHGV